MAGLVGVAALPASCLGGQSLGLSAHSLHPAESARFMAFLASYDQQAEMAQTTGQPPALEAPYLDEDLLAAAPPLKVLRTSFGTAVVRPALAVYGDVSETIYGEVNKMLAGAQDIDSTMVRIQASLESLLR
jgi:multiple sugar transport system substrate-binding protein